MRPYLFISVFMLILILQVFVGIKAFFPEALETKDSTVESIMENSVSILDEASPEDIAFIATNPVIRVGVDPNFYPIEMFDERGRYTGLGGDYLKILERITGLRFKPYAAGNWADTEKQAKNGELDLLPAAARTGRRNEFLLFTPPYVNLPGILMAKRDSEKLDTNALTGKKIAVVDGYSWHDFLREYHPEIIPVPSTNTLDAIEKVLKGEADAVLDYEFNLMEKIQTSGIMQMEVAGKMDSNYGHALAVRKDLPELFDIISLAMKQISPDMQDRLAQKWFRTEKPDDGQKRLQWIFFLLVESLLISLGAWLFVKKEAREMAQTYLDNC